MGGFDARREGVISYESVEDLTRKVDALFHRRRSPLSTEAAFKMSEDDLEDAQDDLRYDTSSTCPSTVDTAVGQEEGKYEYGFHLDDALDLNPIVRNDNKKSPSQYNGSTLSTIATADDGFEHEYDDFKNDDSSVDYLPEFLKNTKFKTGRNISSNVRKQKRKQLDAIPLPKKPSSSSAPPSSLLGRGSIATPMKSSNKMVSSMKSNRSSSNSKALGKHSTSAEKDKKARKAGKLSSPVKKMASLFKYRRQ